MSPIMGIAEIVAQFMSQRQRPARVIAGVIERCHAKAIPFEPGPKRIHLVGVPAGAIASLRDEQGDEIGHDGVANEVDFIHLPVVWHLQAL